MNRNIKTQGQINITESTQGTHTHTHTHNNSSPVTAVILWISDHDSGNCSCNLNTKTAGNVQLFMLFGAENEGILEK